MASRRSSVLDESDLVHLIRGGVQAGGRDWADLGSGDGAFTLALASLLEDGARIWSVDRDPGSIARQQRRLGERYAQVAVDYRVADFRRPLDLPDLDGIVMANSLHFVRKKEPVLDLVRGYLKPGGRLVLVEYNADRGNPWVPHPLSYPTWERMAADRGFAATRLLERVPSRFLGEIYSALSLLPRGSAA